MKLGALEAGGTKMVCAIGDETGKIYDQVSIPTETPDVTIPKLIEYFEKNTVDALGIASFGPVELDPKAPNYGYITTTTKVAWRNFDMAGSSARALKCPIGFDTDVNGSVLGEVTFGQARGKSCVIYLTIGTGVGAGIYIEDKLLHGMLHPEAGHVLIEKRNGDAYAGKCPYHRNCLEGLAVGSRLYSPGTYRLCTYPVAGDDHFRRRRHASETALPTHQGKGDRISGRIHTGGRTSGYGSLHRTGKPA